MRKGAFILLVLGASFFIPTTSYGAVILSQGDYASATSTSSTNDYWQTLGTGISGTISTVDFIMQRTHGADHNVTWSLYSYDDAGYTTGQTLVDNTTFTLSTTTAHVISRTSTYSFNPTKYYVFVFSASGGESFNVFGTNYDSFAGGQICANGPNVNCGTSLFKDYYFYIRSLGTVQNNTRIVSLNAPLNGATTVSTTVLLDIDYYFNSAIDYGNYTYVGTDVKDTSNSQIILTDSCDIVATGQSKCARSVVLTEGHFYLWRAYLGSNQGNFIYSPWYSFSVVSGAGQTILPTTDEQATSTLEAFAQVPFNFFFDTVFSKWPFSWALEFSNQIRTDIDSPTAYTVASTTLDFNDAGFTLIGSSPSATTTATSDIQVDLFGQGYIDQLADIPWVITIRDLIGTLLYLSLLIAIFKEVTNAWS